MQSDQNFLILERREKLNRLREAGFSYPSIDSVTPISDYLKAAILSEQSFDSSVYCLAGRLSNKRCMGNITFVNIADSTGSVQVVLKRDDFSSDLYEDFKSFDIGDIFTFSGTIFFTKTKELSLKATSYQLLSKCLRPLPDKHHGITDTELKYRKPYLEFISDPDSRLRYKKRAKIISTFRSFLDAEQFLEVETPMMHEIPGGANARPFVTHHNSLDRDLYLRIAPELYLKKLLVGGFDSIYEIGRCFRNEGLSTRHNPEFTMIELYKAYSSFESMLDRVESMILAATLSTLGTTSFTYEGNSYDFSQSFSVMKMTDAIKTYNPMSLNYDLDSLNELIELAQRLNTPVYEDDTVGHIQTRIFEHTVEDKLIQPTFVTHHPLATSPLAKAESPDSMFANRFELYIAGREIANGFSELNDPDDQALRFRAQATKKGNPEENLLYDASYIEALEYGMPPATGAGIGIDRLAMILTGSSSIKEVILFPHLRKADSSD
jgi:lysyl-tRNA synthetase class 2